MQQILLSFLLFTAFEAKVHTKVTSDFGFTQAHQRILAVAIQVSPLVGIVFIGEETVEFPCPRGSGLPYQVNFRKIVGT
jgi:hypothetical protein